MAKSWDDYYSQYSDWDDSHSFNVRIELIYEDKLNQLGYKKFEEIDDFVNLNMPSTSISSDFNKTYRKCDNELLICFDVPYDWSIDTDWEDRALALLGIKEEWVIDSSVDNK